MPIRVRADCVGNDVSQGACSYPRLAQESDFRDEAEPDLYGQGGQWELMGTSPFVPAGP